MTSLDLSRNQFSGNIPNTIGGLQHLSKLSLAHNRLQGSIPQSLGNINSLEFLDLSENNLSGEIPKSLETLVYLKYMNLSYNRLHGEIPAEGAFANFTAQSFMMNDALCSSQKLLHLPPCHVNAQQGKKSKLYLLKYVLPVIASSTFILTCILAFIRFQRKRKTIPPQTDLIPIPLQTRISHHELLLATTGLDESNLIGKGSFGSVYKGILFDGTIVACKVFNLEVEAAFKSFDVECEVMRSIRHRNIVKIISSCSNIDIKALVLEYVPNGSLEKWLYSHNNYLNIEQRMNIMIDIASALEYLRHDFSTSIVHCDLKPSTVLLDEEMVAHVGDFGIAKLLGEGASTIQTNTLATIGYTAPEYGTDGIVSTSGDVYSYGIMLMEILTRKKPTDDMFDGDKSLKNWVRDSLNGSLIEVVDSNLLREEEKQFVVKEECLYSILTLAMDCARDLPEERVNMKNIVTRLKKIKHKFLSFSL